MQFLPGWTVQCLNPDCLARGQWVRMQPPSNQDLCNACGAPLHNVPPPLSPRLRARARPMLGRRPLLRPR